MGRLLEMHNQIDWVPVDSTVLQAVAYLAQRRLLYLKFKSGEIYRYFDFPPQQYRDFLAAESKGTYFGKHIRNSFQYEQLPRSRHAGG
jgi:KTSC domain-containing protein